MNEKQTPDPTATQPLPPYAGSGSGTGSGINTGSNMQGGYGNGSNTQGGSGMVAVPPHATAMHSGSGINSGTGSGNGSGRMAPVTGMRDPWFILIFVVRVFMANLTFYI
jgi:hypothetical protein